MIQKEGILLPVLAFVVVLTPLIASTFYARYVLKMSPAIICGALAGLLTCTAGLNAVVTSAESETPVLGYTVPYAIANVLLTLLGPCDCVNNMMVYGFKGLSLRPSGYDPTSRVQRSTVLIELLYGVWNEISNHKSQITNKSQ